MKIYSVYDSKVGAYLNPIFMRSNGEALRAFQQAAQTKDHEFSKYASDFTLFELGAWDDTTAKVDMHLTPISLGVAVEFVRDEPSTPVRLNRPTDKPEDIERQSTHMC